MKEGLWYSVGGPPLSESVEISIEKRDQFTTAVIAREVRPRPAELAVISMNGNRADYLAVSQRGRQIATGQITILFSNCVPLEGLEVMTIRSKLPSRFYSRFDPPAVGPWRPSPRLWQEIQRAIQSEGSVLADRLRDLWHMIESSQVRQGRQEGGLEVFERDAVASAIQVWGGDSTRKRVLRSAVPSRSNSVAPFLSQLSGISVREDPLIEHDHFTFPGMNVARKDVVGSVVVRDPNGDDILTILNCNRQPLEATLGVDLIYYNHRYDSFVLVQYKRMTIGKSGIPRYRPSRDPNHGKELEMMRAAERAMRALPRMTGSETTSFRLSTRPFFMKLCESRAKVALDAGMVSGLYIPLGLWRRQLRSPEVRGPRGGVVMNWITCPRRFNNSEFTRLLRQGWIGSAAGASAYLSTVIENVLGNGRMLVLAATSEGRARRDYRRDGMGRFASEDDPAGSL